MAYFDKYGVEFSDDRKILVKCPEDFQGEYVIPQGVKCISRDAFRGCEYLSCVEIPESVEEIWYDAFPDCCNLHSITIPYKVSWIGKHAFGCYTKITSLTWNAVHCMDGEISMFEHITPFGAPEDIINFKIGSRVEHIPEGLCYCMSNLTSIVIPDNVLSIGASAFRKCQKLSNITLSKELQRIGNYAFKLCSCLKSISIPDSVIEIGEGAFLDCDSLKEIIVPQGQKNRFAAMEGLKDVTDLIVEVEETCISNPSKRTWEDCEEEWQRIYDNYAKQNNKSDAIIYQMIMRGKVPFAIPPIGICLTSEEYNRFKAEGRDFKKIHAWCWSGKEMHERVRLSLNTPYMVKHGENKVGLLTPRKGIYKVVDINDIILRCYYLGQEVFSIDGELDFLDEIVEINSGPLYNYYSEGPKNHEIEIGDIINVRDNNLIKLHLSEGKTYSITWDYYNENDSALEEDPEDMEC